MIKKQNQIAQPSISNEAWDLARFATKQVLSGVL